MKNILLPVIIISIFIGCSSTKPVYRLTPSTVENKDYWNRGQQFVYTSDKNILYECAFNRTENKKIIFDVKITNQSDTTILVDPVLFQEEVLKNDSERIVLENAYDPEMVIMGLSVEQNRQMAKAKNAAIFGFGAALLSAGAICAVAASSKDNFKKELAYDAIEGANVVTQTVVESTIENANTNAENQQNVEKVLSDALLRKTTVAKGYFIDGEVHFPYYEKASWYHLILKAEDSRVDFYFRHTQVYNLPDNHTSQGCCN